MLVNYIIDVLEMDENLSANDREVIRYGLEMFLGTLLGLVATLIVGICFGSLVSGIVLWILIFPLRKNAGGYHAKTKLSCFFISITIEIVSFALFYQKELSKTCYMIIALLCMCYIYRKSPVGTANKQLDEIEKIMYRKRARWIVITEFILFICALFIGMSKLSRLIVMAFFIVSLALLQGHIDLQK